MKAKMMRSGLGVAVCGCLLLCAGSAAAQADQAKADQPKAVTPDKLTYKNMPDLPRCLTVGVASGDPMSGPSTMVLKFAPKCEATMHWHTPNEQLVMVKGSGMLQMKGEAPKPATVGAYNNQPSKHPHRFTCGAEGECLLYLISDAKFDIHWINDSGKEIALSEAEKSAGKK